MKDTIYRAEAENAACKSIEGSGFRTAAEAQRWAADMMPDAIKLTLRTEQGQSRGWYQRTGGIGEWQDADMWGKSR